MERSTATCGRLRAANDHKTQQAYGARRAERVFQNARRDGAMTQFFNTLKAVTRARRRRAAAAIGRRATPQGRGAQRRVIP
jgi:hypothetical protein